jgi:hypothetical protein
VEALEHAARVLLAPLASLGVPSARVFLPYLVTSALLAALVWARARRPHGVSLLGYLFPWRLFLHPSSRFDVKWLFVRAPLRWLVGLRGAGAGPVARGRGGALQRGGLRGG